MAKAAAAPVQPTEPLDTSFDRRFHVPWVSDVERHGHNRLAVSGAPLTGVQRRMLSPSYR